MSGRCARWGFGVNGAVRFVHRGWGVCERSHHVSAAAAGVGPGLREPTPGPLTEWIKGSAILDWRGNSVSCRRGVSWVIGSASGLSQ